MYVHKAVHLQNTLHSIIQVYLYTKITTCIDTALKLHVATLMFIQRRNLHFLDKHGVRVWEDDSIDASHGGPWVEEVDPQVSVVTLLTLADVLWRRE